MGEPFSAKDFRTWAANLLCASGLAELPAPERATRARRRQVAQVMRDVSEHLGNTPAVCRASYVFDTLIRRWEKGQVVKTHIENVDALGNGKLRLVERSERALVALLTARAA
jgi:DNA topoisomerase-1